MLAGVHHAEQERAGVRVAPRRLPRTPGPLLLRCRFRERLRPPSGRGPHGRLHEGKPSSHKSGCWDMMMLVCLSACTTLTPRALLAPHSFQRAPAVSKRSWRHGPSTAPVACDHQLLSLLQCLLHGSAPTRLKALAPCAYAYPPCVGRCEPDCGTSLA